MQKMAATVGATLLGWLGAVSQSWATAIMGPEIDVAGSLTGLAVLAGVLAMVAERRRRKK